MPANSLLLSSSPHIYSGVSTRRLMLSVIIALLPATVFGVVLYGLPALGVILTSVAATSDTLCPILSRFRGVAVV